MGEGNGFRPVNCKGRPLRRCSRRSGLGVSVAVVPSVPFQPASGSWLMAFGDAPGGFTPLLSCAAARAETQKLD